MWNWKNNQWLAACVVCLLAAAPAQALIISKSNTTPVVVGSQGAETLIQSVVFNAGDFSGAADDVVQNLTIGIDFIKCGEALFTPLPSGCSNSTSADNASVSQIGFSLTDPSGLLIDLVVPNFTYLDTDPGGRIQVTLDDSAAELVGFSNPSFMSGTFYPYGFLTDFAGIHATGAWNLAITNAGAGAPLGVAAFTVNVNVNEALTVPEPDTYLLLVFGLAGIMGYRTVYSRSPRAENTDPGFNQERA